MKAKTRFTIHPALKKLGVNVKMFRAVQKHVRANPRRLDMGNWVAMAKESIAHPQLEPNCGTVACMAGWTVLLAAKEQGLLHSFKRLGMFRRTFQRALCRLPDTLGRDLGPNSGSVAVTALYVLLPGLKHDWDIQASNYRNILFHNECWPARFERRYDAANNAREAAQLENDPKAYDAAAQRMAEVFCDRIDYFLQRGK